METTMETPRNRVYLKETRGSKMDSHLWLCTSTNGVNETIEDFGECEGLGQVRGIGNSPESYKLIFFTQPGVETKLCMRKTDTGHYQIYKSWIVNETRVSSDCGAPISEENAKLLTDDVQL